MKKIIIAFLLLSSFVFMLPEASAGIFWAKKCWFNGNIWSSLDGCLSNSPLVDASWNTLIEGNVKNQIRTWTTAIATLLGLLAVGAIVYGGLLMTLSGWEEEKIKKWKDVVKWSLIWFLAIVTTGALIRVIVEFVFDIAK